MARHNTYVIPGALVAFALAGSGAAQAEEQAEVTIDAVSMGGTMAEVSEGRIELPERASEEGREASGEGLETANEARERHRELNREQSREMREDAREVRRSWQREESVGRPGGTERPERSGERGGR
ncbi:MAG: hypothetical protein R6U87_05930 [Thiohalospira sp.]